VVVPAKSQSWGNNAFRYEQALALLVFASSRAFAEGENIKERARRVRIPYESAEAWKAEAVFLAGSQ
jgi:hypothetical protein